MDTELEVRRPAVAGAFYPMEQTELSNMINTFFENANVEPIRGELKAIISPHAGYIYSGPVAAYGYKLMQLHNVQKNVILLGPSHYTAFEGLAESGFKQWATPLGIIDAFSIRNQYNTSYIHINPQAHIPEHSLEVQIPFLQSINPHVKIDPILTGDIASTAGGEILSGYEQDYFFIASSDLSHYHVYDEAVRIDKKTIDAIIDLDTDRFEEIGDACGKKGISILMRIAEKKKWKAKLLKYANSGDTAGPKDEVVGYTSIAFYK